jgi:hypothetical protein
MCNGSKKLEVLLKLRNPLFKQHLNDASIPSLKYWKTKAAIVFAIAAATEIAQAFGNLSLEAPLIHLTL